MRATKDHSPVWRFSEPQPQAGAVGYKSSFGFFKPRSRVCLLIAITAAVLSSPGHAYSCEEGQYGSCQLDTECPTGSYEIVRGDTLWGISEEHLGNPFCWCKLAQANSFISNPDLVYPGKKLVLLPVSLLGICLGAGQDRTGDTTPPDDIPPKIVLEPIEPDENFHPELGDGFEEELQLLSDIIDPSKSGEEIDDYFDSLVSSISSMDSATEEALFRTAYDTEDKVRSFLDISNTHAERSAKFSLDSPIRTGASGKSTRYEIVGEAELPIAPVGQHAPPEKVITVLFLNGVGNLWFQASESNEKLRSALEDHDSEKSKSIRVDMVWNTTHGTIADLLEVYLQKIESDDPNWSSLGPADRFWARIYGRAPDTAEKQESLTIKLLRKIENQLYETRLRTLSKIRKSIRETSCGVVAVAHSQGNLFANRAWGDLDPLKRPHVGIIAVASPASTYADGTEESVQFVHYTNTGDRVIGWLAKVAEKMELGKPLNANVEYDSYKGDHTAHGFIESYLGPAGGARKQLLDRVFSEVDTVRKAALSTCDKYISGQKRPPPPTKGLVVWLEQNVLLILGLTLLVLVGVVLIRRRGLKHK